MQTLRNVEIKFPLFDTHDSKIERIRKIHEELGEVAQEATVNQVVNVERLLLESMDVVQTAIGVAYSGLSEIMDEEKAVAILEVLVSSLNETHCNKIEQYKDERGWSEL